MQQLLDFNFYLKHKFWLRVRLSRLHSTTEFTGIVYVCPYAGCNAPLLACLG